MMPETTIDPWFTLSLAVLLTVFILILDALLWQRMGADATFSRAVRWLFDRWPITAGLLFTWIGILIGHLLPSR